MLLVARLYAKWMALQSKGANGEFGRPIKPYPTGLDHPKSACGRVNMSSSQVRYSRSAHRRVQLHGSL